MFLPGHGEDAPQAAQVEHIQAFLLCCIRCPGLATIEERSDDVGSQTAIFVGVVSFWFSQPRCESFDMLHGCRVPNPLSYFGVKRGDVSHRRTKVDEAVDRFKCIVLDEEREGNVSTPES